MIEGHISKAFDGALAELHLRVIVMGGLVLDQVREATHAYTEWDKTSARRVIEREKTVNAYDTTIDEEQLALIAQRQPMASDLRAVVAMSKAVAELERAGDEAKKIVRPVLGDAGRPDCGTTRDVRHLGHLATNLLRRALEAFDLLEWDLAAGVIAGDKDLDVEYAAGLRRLLTRAMQHPTHFDVTLEAAFVLKSLERIGDHARNLARHLQAIRGDVASVQNAMAPVCGG